jgi:PDZ domain/Outer membrane protein beta-barrel domain
MRVRNALVAIFCFLCLSAAAEDVSKVDIFGGYSFLSIGEKDISSRESLNGWEASVSGNLKNWFALEGDVSGHYKSVSAAGVTATFSDYTFAGGPRFNFKPLFAHVLVGGDRISASAFGFSASHDGLSVAAGGGLQWGFLPHLSARASADYVLDRHNVSVPGITSTTITLNNVRASFGIVYSFGGRSRSATRPAAPRESRGQGLRIASLGIEAETYEQEGGARIMQIAAGSAADRAGLRVADVIRKLDGKPIRSVQELNAAVNLLETGRQVHLNYLRAYWESETTVTLEAQR